MCRRRMECSAGRANSELTVAVRVAPTDATASLDQELPVPED